MKLNLMRHLWGVDETWEQAFPKIKAQGYHGIECPPPPPGQRAAFRRLLARHRFSYVAQIFTSGDSVAGHLASFEAALRDAKSLKPLFINAHSGKDSFSADEGRTFFAGALAAEQRFKIKVAHETHRGRILYNPWTTRDLLHRFPGLQLCCDFSHWVCVCERLLEDQGDILALCADRALHIHARVGHEEGPQVSDPRAPEFQRHLEAHESRWTAVWRSQRRRGFGVSTLTPEFGPPGYLQTLPYTRRPVADLGEICDWMARRQSLRFARTLRA